MKQYYRPSIDLITFTGEKIMTQSGCNCHFDITSNTMMINGGRPDCQAESGHASENPFGVSAPLWTFG